MSIILYDIRPFYMTICPLYCIIYVHLAPSNPPRGLTLARNERNTALLADWDDVVTSPPEGELAFYEVEFRDRGSSIITRLFIDPNFSFASIFNVKEAQSYEV